jgi:hypothetical protein
MLFQASGTNRTLNQAVVIDGAVISGAVADVKSEPALPVLRPPPESTPPPAPVTPLAQEPASAAGLRGLAPAAPAAAASAPALQAVQERSRYLTAPLLRIQGRAKLGTTKELEIDAVRAPR